MIDFLQFIDETNKAESEEKIFELFQQQLSQLGFDRVVYTLATDHASIGQKAGHGIMRNYPEDWMKYYAEQNYVDIDPVIKLALTHDQPFVWDEMHKALSFMREQKKLLNEAKEAKLFSGIGLGIRGPNNERVALGFASSDPATELTPNTLSLIRAMSNQFHYAYCELKRKKLQGGNLGDFSINLTRKELEVLRWIAKGKNLCETADIMQVTHHAINYHMKQIYTKLQANTQPLAIVKAIKFGLLKAETIV